MGSALKHIDKRSPPKRTSTLSVIVAACYGIDNASHGNDNATHREQLIRGKIEIDHRSMQAFCKPIIATIIANDYLNRCTHTNGNMPLLVQ